MDKSTINKLVKWIKNYVNSAKAQGVVIGMSGGKDSFVVAKLCTMAVGKENILGLILPNGEMTDKSDAEISCEYLGIPYKTININKAYDYIIEEIKDKLPKGKELSEVTTINTAPRIRMTTFYAMAGSLNYLVANTSNLSETMVGYSTKWGDNVGDFAPIADFTKTEVCEIGLMLGLPEHLVNKTPSDGLSGKSDEDKLGFSYNELDAFIRTGKKGEKFDIIDRKNKIAQHKIKPIAKFKYNHNKNYFNIKNEKVL